MLQPLYELLHLIHEHSPPLGGVAVLVPLEDYLLRQHLSLVEQQYDLVETLQEVLVVVTELLNLHKDVGHTPCLTTSVKYK